MRVLDFTVPNEEHEEHERILGHYSTYWAGESFRPLSLNEEQIATQRSIVLRNLSTSEKYLEDGNIPIEDLTAALFIGNGTANGHALLDGDTAMAWFAIECFESEEEAKIFTMHELIHALHYSANPEFAFRSFVEKNLVWRQLITEGIATYLTKRLLNSSDEAALWAGSLPDEQLHSWMSSCRNSERELFEFVARHFDSSDPAIELFYASDSNDIYSFRAGYYVGLKVMEAIFEKHGFTERELLQIPFQEMKPLVLEVLSRGALSR